MTLIECTPDVYRAAHAHGLVTGAGAKVGGLSCDRGRVEQQFRTVEGELLARKETAGGDRVRCWLRADLHRATLAAMAAAAAEIDRIKAETLAYAAATRRQAAERPEAPPLSEPLIHAAMRHSARIGRLHDMNGRGDAERGKFARLLRAVRKRKEESPHG